VNADVPESVAPFVRDAALDHVAVAVRSLEAGARLFRDVLGGRFIMGADVTSQAFRFVHYRFPGGGKIELVTPLGPGFVQKFLDTRGEGVHHMTLKVTGMEGQVERLRASGIEPILVNFANPNWKEAFLHPKDASGVLIQLAESANTEEDAAEHLRALYPEERLLSGG